MKNWKVHKLGGSCFTDAEGYKNVRNLISRKKDIIIVSAVYGITDMLLKLLNSAAQKRPYTKIVETIRTKHASLIKQVAKKNQQAKLTAEIQNDLRDIESILNSISILGSYSDEIYDLVLGFGEQWSAKLLTAYLCSFSKAVYIDARKVIFIEKDQYNIHVHWRKSEKALASFCARHPADIYIVTGFIASYTDGKHTTLGRNGSDFSASIFAKLTHAKNLTFWKDVDGIMSADPRRVPSAFVLDELTYEETLELAYFGAGVIHPKAIAPAVEKSISIFIRNSFNPAHRGTKIYKGAQSQHSIKGLTHIDKTSLVTIEGSGMIGVPGFAARVFEILHDINVSVILITQASSEHSICFAIPTHETNRAVDRLKRQLRTELREKVVKRIVSDSDCSILAVVGENMAGTYGIAAKICKALANASVNIKAIAQGSSERNVSLVIDSVNVTKALRAVHSAFYLSRKTISIGLIGSGLIGKTLLAQLQKEQKRLEENHNLSLRIGGIMNSKRMLLNDKGINLTNWERKLNKTGEKADIRSFINHIVGDEYPHNVILDCTASEKIAGMYIDFIKHGMHVITPNKKAGSSPYSQYSKLMQALYNSQSHYFHETTVCAGLPVITTLQDLLATGDEIIEIEGIFSGTLAYIFYHFNETNTFSDIVKTAKNKGLTEPDPRDDLSGMDIARKVVILAREIGLKIDIFNVKVQSLVPKALEKVSVKEYLSRLPSFDRNMTALLRKAAGKKERLRYVGNIQRNGRVSVELKSYPLNHAFCNLKESDNIVSFRTRRYDNQPLIVKGPGAGAEVTAAGVFADILRLARSLE
jgi:aspartokinase/homoserine dehydrogenase 1